MEFESAGTNLENVRDYTYDADGRYDVITYVFGSDETRTTYSYDADGRTTERRTVGAALTSVESGVWTCP